jgi:hypothetical protein
MTDVDLRNRLKELREKHLHLSRRHKQLHSERVRDLKRIEKLLADNAAFKGEAIKSKLSTEGRLHFGLKPPIDIGAILGELKRLQVPIVEKAVDVEDFDRWFSRMNYEEGFPTYKKEFSGPGVLRRKALEHYLSIELCDVRPTDVFMDVASSNSIVPELLRSHYGLERVYRQDLRYPEGIDGWTIGSDARAIPLPDESVDVVTLHNSIEHFDGGADAAFILEAARLLRPAGRLCVIPLFLANRSSVYTNESLWPKFGVPAFPEDADVYLCDVPTHFAHFSSPERLKSHYIDPVATRVRSEVAHYSNIAEALDPADAAEIDRRMPFALVQRRI